MIELIEQYSNQIAMILTAILPALTALAALITIVRNVRNSEKKLLVEAKEMRSETTNIKKLVTSVGDLAHQVEESNKRNRALESQVTMLTQEVIDLRNKGASYVKADTK